MAQLTIVCPVCRKPAVWQDNPDRPFCSERCKLIDLGCWADESYRLPVMDANNNEVPSMQPDNEDTES